MSHPYKFNIYMAIKNDEKLEMFQLFEMCKQNFQLSYQLLFWARYFLIW